MRANKESRGVVDSQSQPCMKVSEQHHALAACTPEDGPTSAHWITGLVGHQSRVNILERGKISCSCQGLNLRLSSMWHTLQNICVFVYSFLLRGIHLLDTMFLYVKVMIMCTQERPETVPVSMILDNLTSYHNYTVSVVACTTACSEKSPPVTVQTDIGGRLWACYCMFWGDNH